MATSPTGGTEPRLATGAASRDAKNASGLLLRAGFLVRLDDDPAAGLGEVEMERLARRLPDERLQVGVAVRAGRDVAAFVMTVPFTFTSRRFEFSSWKASPLSFGAFRVLNWSRSIESHRDAC